MIEGLDKTSKRVHVAVIFAPYVDLILRGEKTIESRLSVTRRAPFGCAQAGDRLYIKERGGAIRATAIIDRVRFDEDLSPTAVQDLANQYNDQILGPPDYWRSKHNCKYASLLWLTRVESVSFGPRVPAFYGSAWRILPQDACVYPSCVVRAA